MNKKARAGKPSRKRWVCPLCSNGHLAPSKPRKNSALRYCLPCTSKTGKLVERECPALDNQRKKKAEAKKESVKRKRERRPPKPRRTKRSWMEEPKWSSTCGRSKHTINIMEMTEKICKSKAWDEGLNKACEYRRTHTSKRGTLVATRLWDNTMKARGAVSRKETRLHGPSLRIRRGSAGGGVSGRAGEYYGVTMTVAVDARASNTLSTLLHEIAHVVHDTALDTEVVNGVYRPHGMDFNIIMLHLAKELWGYPRNPVGAGYMVGNGYAPTRHLEKWLLQQIEDGNQRILNFMNIQKRGEE